MRLVVEFGPITPTVGPMLSHMQGSLLVGEEHLPVVPFEASGLGAGPSLTTGVACSAAVLHVTAAHRIWNGTASPCSGGGLAACLLIIADKRPPTVDFLLLWGRGLRRRYPG